MLNDRSTPLSLLETRRSARPRDLVAPGPDADQLRRMLRIASRTPDHGALVPYRFIVIGRDRRDALADLYARALRAADPAAPDFKLAKSIANARAAPVLVVLLSCPITGHKIPVWEQQLTCGAVGMNLLHAGHALGFAGGWITGWPASDPMVQAEFCRDGERIAGLFYFGTPGVPLEDRERPDPARIVDHW